MRRTTGLLGRGLLLAVLLAPCAPGAEAALDEPFQKILGFQLGQDAGPLNQVAALAREAFGQPEQRRHVERQLLAALQHPKATADCKRFVCRQLVVVGTEACVPVLAALLPDEEMSHMARYALARIEAPAAGQALREALGKVRGRPRLGIITSLGDRRDAEAVPSLAELMRSDDAALAHAAVAALGKIGSGPAVQALRRARKGAEAALARACTDALLRCADSFLAQGQKDAACSIYEELRPAVRQTHLRIAVLRGLVLTAGKDAPDLLAQAFLGDDPAMQAAAAGLVRDVPGQDATRTFASLLPQLSPEAQALLITALADRGDPAAAPAVLPVAKDGGPPARVAALQALATLGDATAVPVLARALAAEEAPVAGAARHSLVRLRGEDVNAALLAVIRDPKAPARADLVRCLADRRAKDTVPALLQLVDDEDEAVRREAFRAIGLLADETALPALVSRLLEAQGEAARRAAEKAVVTVAEQLEKEEQRTAAILAAMPKADVDGKVSLLRILARFGGPKALDAAQAAAKSTEPRVRDAAVRALSNWPDAGPADTLLDIIKTTDNATHRVLALRGYVRLVALPSNRSAKETLGQCQQVMDLAKTPAEKKLVLSAMANVHHPLALEVIQPYAQDPELKAEAQAAIKKIKEGMNKPAKATASHNPQKAMNALDGKPDTRWDTGKPMEPGMWYQVEFGLERTFTKLVLDTRGSRGDYPRGYEVYVSRDGKNWGKPVATGEGSKPVTEIPLRPATGRFLRIIQTGRTKRLFWSIHELTIESK